MEWPAAVVILVLAAPVVTKLTAGYKFLAKLVPGLGKIKPPVVSGVLSFLAIAVVTWQSGKPPIDVPSLPFVADVVVSAVAVWLYSNVLHGLARGAPEENK